MSARTALLRPSAPGNPRLSRMGSPTHTEPGAPREPLADLAQDRARSHQTHRYHRQTCLRSDVNGDGIEVEQPRQRFQTRTDRSDCAPNDPMSKANLLAQDLERASRTDLITTSLGSERSNVSGTASAEEVFRIEGTLLVRVGRIHAAAVVLDLSVGPLQL